MGISPLGRSVLDEMDQRVYTRVRHIRILVQIVNGIEQGMRVRARQNADTQEMEHRIETRVRRLGVVSRIKGRVEQWMRRAALECPMLHEMDPGIQPGVAHVGVLFDIVGRVKQHPYQLLLRGILRNILIRSS